MQASNNSKSSSQMKLNFKNEEKLSKTVWLEDWEETNDSHNDIYLSFHNENPLTKKEKQDDSNNLLDSVVSNSIQSEENSMEGPFLDLLESSLYTITEEGDLTVMLSDEEEDSTVPDEGASPSSKEKLLSLTNNYTMVNSQSKKSLKDVKRRFSLE